MISFRNCFVKMAYKNGFEHAFNGNTKIVNTFDIDKSRINEFLNTADIAISAIGNQHKKSVNTNIAMRRAMRASPEFHACDPLIKRYILM